MPLDAKELPSRDELLRVFIYNPDTGILLWQKRQPNTRGAKIFNARFAGKCAGTIREGYLSVEYNNLSYFAHRIIWKIVTGMEPPEWIDHEDGNPLNNKWNNIRSASHAQNMWNTDLFQNNTSGFRGVSWIKAHRKWRAAISVNGQKIHLGYFSSPELAHCAFVEAVSRYRDLRFCRQVGA